MTFAIIPTTTPAHNCEHESYEPCCDNNDPTDGYWWYGHWVPGYLSLQSWFMPAPVHFSGKVTYYAPGLVEATAAWRGMSLDGFLDGVALMSPSDVGERVYIKFSEEWYGPFLVVDCARRGDMWPVVVHREEAVEVGHKTATLWGLEPPYPEVEVAKDLPRGSTPIVLSEWFQEHATFGNLAHPVLYRAPNEWRIEGVWHTFNDYHELSEEPICATLGCR